MNKNLRVKKGCIGWEMDPHLALAISSDRDSVGCGFMARHKMDCEFGPPITIYCDLDCICLPPPKIVSGEGGGGDALLCP